MVDCFVFIIIVCAHLLQCKEHRSSSQTSFHAFAVYCVHATSLKVLLLSAN